MFPHILDVTVISNVFFKTRYLINNIGHFDARIHAPGLQNSHAYLSF